MLIKSEAMRRFIHAEDGAVTVDWVVLSASIIGIGMIVLGPIAFSANSAAQGAGNAIGQVSVGYTAP